MRAFQFDAVVGGMSDMQSEEPPVVARDGQSTLTNTLVGQTILEVEDGLLAIVAADDDGCISRAAGLDTHGELAVALHLLQIGATTTDDVGAGRCCIDGLA